MADIIARLSGDGGSILSACEPGRRSLQFLIVLIKQCYSPDVAAPIRRKITRWIFDHLLWDNAGPMRQGFWGGLWAVRKLLVALAGATLLTWREWVEHKPPEIAIVALIHFVFVLAAIALLIYTWQWFSRSGKNPPVIP